MQRNLLQTHSCRVTWILLAIVVVAGVSETYAQRHPAHTLVQSQSSDVEFIRPIDVDVDGNTDLLVTRKQSIVWYENKGDGTFSDQKVIAEMLGLSSGPSQVRIADADGDDDQDIFMKAGNDDTLLWFENRGGGDFSGQKVIYDPDFDSGQISAFQLADLNGDSAPDLAFSSDRKALPQISWIPNTGNGTYGPPNVLVDSTSSGALKAADIDGDGDEDLIEWSDVLTQYQVEPATDSGNELQVQADTISDDIDSEILRSSKLRMVDLNGDSAPDVVHFNAGDLFWYENVRAEGDDSIFAAKSRIETNFESGSFAETPDRFFPRDLDQDGNLDILFDHTSDDGNQDQKRLSWIENDGTASFSDRKTLEGTPADPVPAMDTGIGTFIVADLGGSAAPEVLFEGTAGRLGRGVYWRPNKFESGNGFDNLQQLLPRDLATGLGGTEVADIDGDGDKDVVGFGSPSDRKPATAYWFENVGGGQFERVKTITDTTEMEFISVLKVRDINQDGALDIVYGKGQQGAHRVAWKENLGGGDFSGQTIVSDTTNRARVRTTGAADLDEDGDQDVIAGYNVSSQEDFGLFWYEQLEDGSFSSRRAIATSDVYLDVHPADIDQDGDVDLVGANDTQGRVEWVMNADFGFIDGGVIARKVGQPQSVHTTDLTSDGRPDVIYGSRNEFDNTGRVAWAPNDSTGGIGSPSRLASVENAESVYAADLNGDGAKDILAGMGLDNRDGNERIEWYQQASVDGATSFSQGRLLDDRGASTVRAGDMTGDGTPNAVAQLGGRDTDPGTDRRLLWYESLAEKRPLASTTHEVKAGGTFRFRDTGVQLRFPDVSEAGTATVKKFSGPASDTSGIAEQNVSSYRYVVQKSPSLQFDSTAVRFEIKGLRGLKPPPEGDPKSVQIYRRGQPGQGEFQSISTRVDSNETFETSDDQLVATVAGFSEFVLASNTEPLPVEMAGFEGTAIESGVQLTWQTASETNNAGFEVQRKAPGEPAAAWQEIGFVESGADEGTTREPRRYRFTDENIPFETDELRYRLRQVDLDGTESFTDPVSVERKVSEMMLRKTVPNPARGQATVQFAVPESQDVTLRMYDVLGRTVRTVHQGTAEGRQELQMDLSGLASGAYFLRLKAGRQAHTQKLTIIR